ncbi:hypothetical protein D3C77_395600 [compost metagenome]
MGRTCRDISENAIELVRDGIVIQRLRACISAIVFRSRRHSHRLSYLGHDILSIILGFKQPGEMIDAGNVEIKFLINLFIELTNILNDACPNGIISFLMRHMMAIAKGEGFQLRRISA